MKARNRDAIIVGSGPNGLAAAITLARAGYSSLLVEGDDRVGGGTRSIECTLPGFIHDICSAIHPLGLASPFFRSLPLSQFGCHWVHPGAPLAHPLDDGTAVILERSIDCTAQGLGRDARAYRWLMSPLAARWEVLIDEVLGPLRWPKNPFLYAGFGLLALTPAAWLARIVFREPRARALFAGLSAHSILPLEKPLSSAFGLVLGVLAHAVGWPMALGGSQRIADALQAYYRGLGGEIITDHWVESIESLPPSEFTLFDVSPRQLLQIVGDRFPSRYRRKLESYRYGPGVFKIDYALDGPIPWKASECTRASTVHLGGTLEEIARSEREVGRGKAPEQPFVLLVQESLFDPTRAPQGKHTAWAYCHVPNGSTTDMTEAIENQIERFAPGFRNRVLGRSTRNPEQMQAYNPNYIGGDIIGGFQDFRQLFTRPTFRLVPYSTPDPKIFLCSASTPPGGGVHGMCGYYAARTVMKRTHRSI